MILSENRLPLFRIMLQRAQSESRPGAVRIKASHRIKEAAELRKQERGFWGPLRGLQALDIPGKFVASLGQRPCPPEPWPDDPHGISPEARQSQRKSRLGTVPSRLCGLEDWNWLFADELALRDDAHVGHDPAANVVAVAIADGLRDIDAQANATIAAAMPVSAVPVSATGIAGRIGVRRDLVMKISGRNSPGIG
jgi:hypothetical protein